MTRREALRRHDLGELVRLGAVTPEYLQEVEAYDYYKTKAREWKPGKPKPGMEVVKRYRIPSERMRGIVRRMEDEEAGSKGGAVQGLENRMRYARSARFPNFLDILKSKNTTT